MPEDTGCTRLRVRQRTTCYAVGNGAEAQEASSAEFVEAHLCVQHGRQLLALHHTLDLVKELRRVAHLNLRLALHTATHFTPIGGCFAHVGIIGIGPLFFG